MSVKNIQVAKTYPIIRQEGDTSMLEFHVPADILLTGFEARFGVFKKNGDPLFVKNGSISGQIIYFEIDAVDTLHKVGTHLWELEIRKYIPRDEVYTIGKGDFEIHKQLLKNI
jgi:hypothetical protein